MLGEIREILENNVYVDLTIDLTKQVNLVDLHVVFEDSDKKVVGQILSTTKTTLKASIVGEIKNNTFLPGVSVKPSFRSKIRLITMPELELIFGPQIPGKTEVTFGYSNIYENYPINVNINGFFSNHFAILGNSGSGKSFTVSRILQNIFLDRTKAPVNARIILFDAYGEYTQALQDVTKVNNNMHYKTYTSNTEIKEETIKIPIWLLGVDDLALLLDVTTPNQLPIIEKALSLVPILSGEEEKVLTYKNDIIARALEDILLSGHQSTKIRDQVTAVLTKFNTKDLNLDSQIVQPGYVRTLKQCLFIDKTGKLQEMELVVNFVKQFILEEERIPNVSDQMIAYSLTNLEEAMDFALISEGILKSDKVYDYANVLSVRLHSLANSKNHVFFEYPSYVDRNTYVNNLFTSVGGSDCQIINFNISYIDDRLAKVLTKIISKIVFDYTVENPTRGSMPFHIIIEEAHRYVQEDTDTEILGYNIFDRITKEGRKYGTLLGLITQRPSELSDTAISQCSNFIILRTLHPKDLNYIKEMVPNISSEMIGTLKNLKPGNCIAFGSAFKVPISMVFKKPDPIPLSSNVDVSSIWYQESVSSTSTMSQIQEISTNTN